MEPRIETQHGRFRVEKLEERIAPAHVQLAVPERALETPMSEHFPPPSGHVFVDANGNGRINAPGRL